MGNGNLTISPSFLRKMATDSGLAERYEKEIENMPKMDEKSKNEAAQNGVTIVASGWNIDSNGDISSWGVAVSEDTRRKKGNVTSERKKDEKDKKDMQNEEKLKTIEHQREENNRILQDWINHDKKQSAQASIIDLNI